MTETVSNARKRKTAQYRNELNNSKSAYNQFTRKDVRLTVLEKTFLTVASEEFGGNAVGYLRKIINEKMEQNPDLVEKSKAKLDKIYKIEKD